MHLHSILNYYIQKGNAGAANSCGVRVGVRGQEGQGGQAAVTSLLTASSAYWAVLACEHVWVYFIFLNIFY